MLVPRTGGIRLNTGYDRDEPIVPSELMVDGGDVRRDRILQVLSQLGYNGFLKGTGHCGSNAGRGLEQAIRRRRKPYEIAGFKIGSPLEG